MTIDEAIKILSDAAYGHSLTMDEQFYTAQELGLKALVAWREARMADGVLHHYLLPGETEE